MYPVLYKSDRVLHTDSSATIFFFYSLINIFSLEALLRLKGSITIRY